jgi:hypothetical protein
MSDYIPIFDLNVLATEDDEDAGFDLNVPAAHKDVFDVNELQDAAHNDVFDVDELQDADQNDVFDLDEPQDDDDTDVFDVNEPQDDYDEPQEHHGRNASLSTCVCFFCNDLFCSYYLQATISLLFSVDLNVPLDEFGAVDFSYIEHDAGKCFSNDIYF